MLRPSHRATAQSICPLCSAHGADDHCRDAQRQYLQCRECSLVFVPPSQHLSEEAEKQRYDLHNNSIHDLDYRRFLGRMFIPVQQRLAPALSGLDFGCGPGPLLARMFEEAGHSMSVYDHFYERDPAVFEKQYDFITATEVVEHLRDPKGDLERLWRCLRPGGLLGIMTRPAAARPDFLQWYYKNDPTHVCFFSHATFAWLAHRWSADLSIPDRDIALFKK